jgi:hypothetical protein
MTPIAIRNWCVAACATLLTAASGAAELTYGVSLVDARTSARIAPSVNDVALLADGTPLDVVTRNRVAFVKVPSDATDVRIEVDSQPTYANRRITIARIAIRAGAVQEINLEPKAAQFTKQYLLSGVSRLDNGMVDGGIALFEHAFRDDPDRKANAVVDDYEAMLRYNYARSLQQACLTLKYASCGEAKRMLEQIAQDMKGGALAVYTSNRVTPALVDAALADLNTRTVNERYRAAKEDSDAGRLDQARQGFKSMLDDLPRNPQAFTASSISKERLRSDLDFVESRLQARPN